MITAICRLLLLILLVVLVSGENCGNFKCPTGYEGIPSPASRDCGGVCDTNMCCVAVKCNNNPAAQLTAAFINGIADVTSCKEVPDGPCTSTCVSGYGSSGVPNVECIAADTWRVNNPCTPIICDTWTNASAYFVVPLTTAQQDVCNSVAGSSSCPLTCLTGYSGAPTLKCQGDGVWAVGGLLCQENECLPYSLKAGMEPATSSSACPVSAGTVAAGTLKAVTHTECSLQCASGYAQSGSGTLSCSPSFLTPSTSLSCVELNCNAYSLAEGMVPDTKHAVPCQAIGSSVPAGSLKAVTKNECGLTCDTGYTAKSPSNLTCSASGLAPSTTLSCVPNVCYGGLIPPANTSLGVDVSVATTGDALTLGTNASADNIVITDDYYCTGSPTVWCEDSNSAARALLPASLPGFTVVGITCDKKRCTSAFNSWSAHNVNPISTAACMYAGQTCALTCADGYTTSGGAPTLVCEGGGLDVTEPAGYWTLENACVPITCSLASVPAAANNVATPASIDSCNTVPEGTCALTCLDGFKTAPTGPPRFKCIGKDAWAVSSHCIAMCSNSSQTVITGNVAISTGLAAPATTRCVAGSGFLLKASSNLIACNNPAPGNPAMPATDCTIEQCCQITCGFAPCSGEAGFSLKPGANTIRCSGHTTDSCSSATCCTQRTCSPVNTPTVAGAVISCAAATNHGEDCTVTPKEGYSCSGTVSCTAESSDTSSYASTLTCSLVACPINAELPPTCACKAGYSGSPTWSGTTWIHSCVAKSCACTGIANSVSYSSPLSLCGKADDVVPIICEAGYKPSAPATTCNGDTLTFTTVTCDAKTCPSTYVPNSVAHSSPDSISGTTGTQVSVVCKSGYVGRGTSCPDCKATCDGTTFNTIVCEGQSCPVNSGPVGACTCKSGYTGTPEWSPSSFSWTHECKATCGLYSCTRPGASLKQPPANFVCSSTSVSSCSDEICCKGGIVSPTSGLVTTEDGGSAVFTITLISKPLAVVSIAITSSRPTEAVTSVNSVSFNSENWNIAQTVTVTGVSDHIDDGDQAVVIETGACVSSDPNYNTLNFDDVAVRNIDNDLKGVVVTPRSGLATTEAGATDTFTVVLSTQPTAPVSIGVDSSDVTEGTVSTSNLLFTSRNWNIPQTVTVTGVQDMIDDGDVSYQVLLGNAVSNDTNYNNLPVADVSVVNTDDDTSGIVVTPTSGLTVTEKGSTATFTIVLTSEPVANVVIGLQSSDVTEGMTVVDKVTFTPTTWNIMQTVTVVGVDDKIDDGDVGYVIKTAPAISTDGSYSGFNAADVTVTTLDDDTAGFDIAPNTGIATSEAGTVAIVSVSLTSEPLSDVRVTGESSRVNEARVLPSTLTFTPGDYATPQTFTVQGVDDTIDDGDTAYTLSIAATSGDANYNDISPPVVSCVNLDNDTAGITMSPSGIILTTSEGGESDNFTIVLQTKPSSSVTISFSGDSTEGRIEPSTITFNTRNWNVPTMVTVTGLDDWVDDGDVLYSIKASIDTADPKYASISLEPIPVKNLDDDTRGITIKPTTRLMTTEGGAKDTFTMVLDSQPTGDVSITLQSSNVNEGTVSPTRVLFTVSSWNTPATLTVTGVQDTLQDGDVVYQVTTTLVSSADAKYNGLRVADVSVVNIDDDTPGIAMNPPRLNVSEDGASATLSIQLKSVPTTDVAISLVTDATEATLSPSTVVFNKANWNIPQAVIVTGKDDSVADGNVTFAVQCKPALSADGNYKGLTAPDVSVMNIDNDKAGIAVTPDKGLVTSENGSRAVFTVVLTSEPTADATVLVQGDATEVSFTPAQLVFTSATWDTPKTVTLTGVDDNVVDGDVQYTLTISEGGSDDANYDNQMTLEMLVTNKDNDTAGVDVSTTQLWTTEAGGHDTLTLTLTSIPSSDVTITLESTKLSEGTISPSEVTFAPAQWRTPQTVTVTGVDDAVDDGNVTWVMKTTVQSADAAYDALELARVQVTNADDDVHGAVVSPTEGLLTTEGGSQAFFTVALSTQPTADVTIGITSSDSSEGSVNPENLVFTPVTWDTLQTVTVTGVDDLVADGNVTYAVITNPARSADPKYDGFNAADVEVTNLDDDTVGVLVSPTSSLVTTEAGGTAIFTVSLRTQPTATVSFLVTSSDLTEGAVSEPVVSFSPGDWNTKKTITVTGVDDPIDDQDVSYFAVLSPAMSRDAAYNGLPASNVSLLNTDDDTPGISIEPSGVLTTTEKGGTAKFTVRLTSRPEASVSLKLASSNPQEGVLSVSSLLFTVAEWGVSKTVEVQGVDDLIDDGDIPYTIMTMPAMSEDPKYNGINAADISVVNIDDDTAGVHVTPTSGLETTEKGGVAQFSVVLTSQPTASVSIGLSSSDITECTASPTSLDFTPDTWSVPIVVTVTGVDDPIEDGDVVVTIATSAATSGDGKYDGLNADDVTVVNKNDDVSGITLSPMSGLVTTEAGGTATFTIVLNSEPTSTVNLTLVSRDPTEGKLSVDSIVFVPSQWNISQTVTVTGVDDYVHDKDVPYSVGISKAASADVLYNGLAVVDVRLTNVDNDVASIVVNPTEGLVTTETGGEAEFTIDLTSMPSGDVTIWVESEDSTEGVPHPLSVTFTPQTWNKQRTVTVTGADDWVDDGDQSYVVHVLAAVSSDADYNGIRPADVLLVNKDNDTRGIDISRSSVTTTEGGGSELITFKLSSQPVAGVGLDIASSDTSEGRVSPQKLQFTASNWNTQQTVTVTGVQDGVVDGDVSYTFGIQVSTHDPDYGAVVVKSITALNKDQVDECVTAGMTCYAAGQECEDTNKDPGSLKDFTCKCAGSSSGSARGAMAACTFTNECDLHGQMCATAGQMCVDPSPDKTGDWQCACVTPLTGTAVMGGLASCTLDECIKSAAVCEAVGQTCSDPNKSPISTNDWTCTCAQPLVGIAVAKAATCKYNGECTTRHTTCAAAGQVCYDPDTKVTGDWQCVCQAPYQGTMTSGVASCKFDECSAHGSTCTDAGQTCHDPNLSKEGDWVCSCSNAFETGSATAMAATCIRDECAQNAVCTAAGQVCKDADTSPQSLGDWACHCIPPAVGTAVGKSATCAFSGECVAFSTICTDAGQTCFDPSGEQGDWMCRCVEPYDMTYAVAKPAVCIYNECDVHAKTCTDAGQLCVDTNTDPRSLSDWKCKCIEPAVGSAMIKPAQCAYQGECRTFQDVCSAVGQACVDSDEPGSSSWECSCVAPMNGTAVRSPAECTYDECITNSKTCSAVGQMCIDPNMSMASLNDWLCECIAPAQGSARAREASCKYEGECASKADVCTSFGQTCKDPSEKDGDWMCLCLKPATGQATAGVASCVYDECGVHATVCTSKGQQCIDPNTNPKSIGDWTCNCVGGASTGTATAEPATCVLDECLTQGKACRAVGQTCTDPNTSPTSKDDWQCHCIAPAVGSRTKGVATCTYEQGTPCSSYASICTSSGQSCHDVTGGGWECACLSPQKGSAREAAASCTLDECEIHGSVCTKKGQECKDTNIAVASVDNWICLCAGSASGSEKMAPAICEYKGECAQRAEICTAAGQSCEDPNENRIGDWGCACVAPLTGKATASVATCILDECNLHGSVCTAVGQRCTDPNTHPLYTDDWRCTCVGSDAVGSQVGGPATCVLDECLQHATTCTNVGQTCHDPNTSPGKTGDWTCMCVAPSVGSATGKAAACSYVGECAKFASICTDVGQNCIDPDTSVSGDWHCECVAPFTGKARGRTAVCDLDECLQHYDACNAGGQTCHDPSSAVGDWMCMCVPPAIGQATQQLASCTYEGECVMNAATCVNAGQACIDPDVTRADDWVCSCPTPLIGLATARSAECELDECITHGKTCTDVGQVCTDPNKSPLSRNDWKCSCVRSAGSATTSPATCMYEGECAVHHQVCTSAGQACVDPSKNDGDWECACVSPQTGKAPGKPASCVLDECKQHASVCNVAAQQCIDPNPLPTSVGDWRCECIGSSNGSAVASAASCTYLDTCIGEGGSVCAAAAQVCYAGEATGTDDAWICACVPPMTGSKVNGVATCVLDECKIHEEICRSSGQTCRDPNSSPSSRDDWICECVAPATGSSVASVAECTYPGECAFHAAVCTSVGQTCVDPDVQQAGDWQCACIAPALGTATGQPATCELDECIKNKQTCESFNQVCNDPTPSASGVGDWTCECVGSEASGIAVGKPASCMIDECDKHADECRAAGQTCNDPNVDPTSLGDWVCTCAGASTGSAVAGRAACTFTDVCAPHASTCTGLGQTCYEEGGAWGCACVYPMAGKRLGGVASCEYDECLLYGSKCALVGQTCSDPNPTPASRNDWTCVCSPPLTGSAVAQIATCGYKGECEANAITCTSVGQDCVDPDVSKKGDWMCVCRAPQSGDPGLRGRASCELDECIVHSNICAAMGQICIDSEKGISSTGNWVCNCIPPAVGDAVASVAACEYPGECAHNAHVCNAVGQTCFDPTSAEGDWMCSCVPPTTGSQAGEPAVCVYDECLYHAHMCAAAGQGCYDPQQSPSSLNDWTCKCIAPAVGSEVGKPAVCTFQGECVAHSSTCTNASQTCRDSDITRDNDWECVCAPPLSGSATVGAAQCVLNECDTHSHVCTSAGQVCHDTDTATTSLNNWECQCVYPAAGSARAKAAVCVVDECIANSYVCLSASQYCVDPDQTHGGDWMCQCVVPQVGSQPQGVAQCTLDECSTNAEVCRAAGQECADPHKSPDSLGDWECRCLGSSTGSATGKPATCSYSGECDTNRTCVSHGQACIDDNLQVTNDWKCKCLPPAIGEATGTPATCTLDECILYGDVCTAAGQVCTDPNTDQYSTGDWVCSCEGSGGTAVASRATCTLDECATEKGVQCISAGQECHDPNIMADSLDDWSCNCVGSSVGTKVAGVASCEYAGECATHALICIQKGQGCYDPDLTKSGDWMCICAAPSSGSPVVGGPASCIVDECTLSGKACTAAGQTCTDVTNSSSSLGDWICECSGSGTGIKEGAAATCTYAENDECKDNWQTCAASEMTCADTGTGTGDWSCSCVYPSVRVDINGVGMCVHDECTTAGRICTDVGQSCHDQNTEPQSTGDWTCMCTGVGASGTATARPAECHIDECVGNTVCSAAGQLCVDTNTLPNKIGDWECRCTASGNGTAVGKPASCSYSGECGKNHATCEAHGQACNDPNDQVNGDWECVCMAPYTGVAKQGVASCMYDECFTHWKTCHDAGQECIDTNKAATSTNDWTCNCVGSSVGSAVAKPATCQQSGECKQHAALCLQRNQACFDGSSNANDWMCVCAAPEVGIGAVGSFAVCVLDECRTSGIVCQARGQVCYDPNTDPSSLDDWRCDCIAPATGSAVGKPATCTETGECEDHAHTCAAVGQSCKDPTRFSQVGDWTCNCVPPAIGSATATTAHCTLDECTIHKQVCESRGQVCHDSNTDAASKGDWVCMCKGVDGYSVASPATCVLDECAAASNSLVCSDVGQACVDPNTALDSSDDWMCVCTGTQTGSAVASAATCTGDNACDTHGSICAAAGQSCFAADDGSWSCGCVPPQTKFGNEDDGTAICKLDECLTHGAVCKAAGQKCSDVNNTADSLHDWACQCLGSEGKATTAAATCTYAKNDCATMGHICTSSGQACYDDDGTVNGKWECRCVAPATGAAGSQATAVCTLDECSLHGLTCSKAGQHCVDVNTAESSVNDWYCKCLGTGDGQAKGKPATCSYTGNCSSNAGHCTASGQTCSDSGDSWYCSCLPPLSGSALRSPAVCSAANECTIHGDVCAAANQDCVDPSLPLNNWRCVCRAPLVGYAVGGAATCTSSPPAVSEVYGKIILKIKMALRDLLARKSAFLAELKNALGLASDMVFSSSVAFELLLEKAKYNEEAFIAAFVAAINKRSATPVGVGNLRVSSMLWRGSQQGRQARSLEGVTADGSIELVGGTGSQRMQWLNAAAAAEGDLVASPDVKLRQSTLQTASNVPNDGWQDPYIVSSSFEANGGSTDVSLRLVTHNASDTQMASRLGSAAEHDASLASAGYVVESAAAAGTDCIGNCGQQLCKDADSQANGAFTCVCRYPLVGEASNAEAVCVERTATATRAVEDSDDDSILGLDRWVAILIVCLVFAACCVLLLVCYKMSVATKNLKDPVRKEAPVEADVVAKYTTEVDPMKTLPSLPLQEEQESVGPEPPAPFETQHTFLTPESVKTVHDVSSAPISFKQQYSHHQHNPSFNPLNTITLHNPLQSQPSANSTGWV
eukprot:TRINITY_DN7402_c1_g1_i14.p1 TRINITY_DN7402_c1_g1~~TRINITY_DN7402_c1_g1_i14.p1  ORF type:complete len:6208 (+),score=1187.89 TRINITY_DN7402_c1_g1_i14:70-18693(+)